MSETLKDQAVGFLTEVARDARRTIYEWNSHENGLSYRSYDIHATMPLGNFFHAKKDKTFHITAGAGVVVLQDMDPHTGTPASERRVLPIKTGSVVFVKAFTAHAFVFEPGSRMTTHSTRPLDEADKDVTVVKLVEPADAAKLLATTPTL